MATLEEILGKLAEDDLKTAVVDLLNAEKERGIESTKNATSETLKLKGVLKNLGWDHEKFKTYDDFIASKNTVDSKVTESTLTIASLNDRVNELTKNLNEEREEKERKSQEAKVNKLTAKLTQDIGSEFYGSQYLIKTLVGDGKVDLHNDDIIFKNGEDVLPYEAGLNKLREENKDIIRSSIKGGTGDVGGSTPKTETETFADLIRKQRKSK